MFVLVVMSHGWYKDRIRCQDNKYIDLAYIRHLLSASNFKGMKGKPKLIIVQACSGGELVIFMIMASNSIYVTVLDSICITVVTVVIVVILMLTAKIVVH